MTDSSPALTRRGFLKGALAFGAAGTLSALAAAPATALGPIRGTVLDYAAGVPSAAAVAAAGHLGAVRYVSGRRPGAEWMLGKPVLRSEAEDFAAHGLSLASVYQYGKGATADWRGPANWHATEAVRYHFAAGGPTGRPIYAAIDDNPSYAEYTSLIRPYLQGFRRILETGGLRLGVYGNYNVIEWCTVDGLGEFFWQHDWGSGGRIHPRTTVHQKAGLQATVGGVLSDINHVYAADWGQWTPGGAGAPAQDLVALSSLSSDLPR